MNLLKYGKDKKKPVTAVVGRYNEAAELDSAVAFGSERRQYSGGETVVAAIPRQFNLFLAADQHFCLFKLSLVVAVLRPRPSFTKTLLQGSSGLHAIAKAVMNVLLFKSDSRLENGGNWQ